MDEYVSDEALVQEVQEGNIGAYETLVKRYQQRLFAFVYRIVWDESTAQEVVQDALFAVYTTIDEIDITRKFSSYVFAIAKNTAISHLRRQKKEVSLGDREIAQEDEVLYEQLADAETKKSVQHAIASLAENYRTIIRLYYFDELSYEEIARKLHIPLNTVRTHLRRAKDALKKHVNYETG